MSLFEIKNVSKSFGTLKVLNDITVSVEEGEVVAIIGPSGSGKSTLLRCATMLETMDSGELSYLGEVAAHNDAEGKTVYASPSELRKIKSYFGLVFQQFNLFPHYTVLKNLCDAPIHVQKRNAAEVKKEAKELLVKMGLEGKEKYYPQQLSGGQQQRVAIARALCMNPDILFFDEPTSALDRKRASRRTSSPIPRRRGRRGSWPDFRRTGKVRRPAACGAVRIFTQNFHKEVTIQQKE